VKPKSGSVSWKIQASEETIQKLTQIAESLGGSISGNGVAAMVVYEAAQVPADRLWLALGALRYVAAKGEIPVLPAAFVAPAAAIRAR
jgi:hypothetical protein